MLLSSEKILNTFSVLDLLGLVLWLACGRSILEKVPCALEKTVFCCFGHSVLKLPIKFIWSNVSFKAPLTLLITSSLVRTNPSSLHCTPPGLQQALSFPPQNPVSNLSTSLYFPGHTSCPSHLHFSVERLQSSVY